MIEEGTKKPEVIEIESLKELAHLKMGSSETENKSGICDKYRKNQKEHYQN